jgi:hypothetical protein
VAGDRPAVVGKKRVEGVQPDIVDVANLPHVSPCSGGSVALPITMLVFDIYGQNARSLRCGEEFPGAGEAGPAVIWS